MMCGSVDGVYLALIGDGAMGRWLSERHGSWTEQGNRRTRVSDSADGYGCVLLVMRVVVMFFVIMLMMILW